MPGTQGGEGHRLEDNREAHEKRERAPSKLKILSRPVAAFAFFADPRQRPSIPQDRSLADRVFGDDVVLELIVLHVDRDLGDHRTVGQTREDLGGQFG